MKMRRKKLLKFRRVSQNELFRAAYTRAVMAAFSACLPSMEPLLAISEHYPIVGRVSRGYHTPMRSI